MSSEDIAKARLTHAFGPEDKLDLNQTCARNEPLNTWDALFPYMRLFGLHRLPASISTTGDARRLNAMKNWRQVTTLRRTHGGHDVMTSACALIPGRALGLAFSLSIAIAAVCVGSGPAAAVVYCQYINYPPSCIARPGVVLRPRPIAREVVRPGTPTNRGGPVDRVGRR
jgi:hypothetical protein